MHENGNVQEMIHMFAELNELAYCTYKPIVDDICSREATESEVEHLLDYMVGICSDERTLGLFKRVCRKYLYLYPEMIESEINVYKDMYFIKRP